MDLPTEVTRVIDLLQRSIKHARRKHRETGDDSWYWIAFADKQAIAIIFDQYR